MNLSLFKKREKNMKTINNIIKDTKKKAFTLIELLIVVAIIGILAGVGVPMYNGYMATAKVKSAETNHSNIKSFVAATLTKCSTGVSTVKLGSITRSCTASISSWDDYFRGYFNAINKNPYSTSAATSASTSPALGQTSITSSGASLIRVRTNVGNEAGSNAYSPASGYDEITKE